MQLTIAILIIVALSIALIDRQGRVDNLKLNRHAQHVEIARLNTRRHKLASALTDQLRMHQRLEKQYKEACDTAQRDRHEADDQMARSDKRIYELKQQLAEAEKKYVAERSLANKEIANLLEKNNGLTLHIAQLRGKGR